MSSLSRKKHVRAGHRGSTTKLIGRADDLLSSARPDVDKLSQLKLTLTEHEKLEVLKLLDGEILDKVEEKDVADEIDHSDGFKEGIYSVLVKIDRALKSAPTTAGVGPTPSSGVPTSDPCSKSRVRLPKLSIKPFNGELTAWASFWESYHSAIHDNPALTDAEKFNYLRSLLERTALDAISGLALTAPNYKEAISVLEKRFGNKQRIVAKHMDALMNLEAVSSQHNLKGIRRLYDTVELHTRSLNSLGVSPESYGGLLASVLMNKLPQELQLIVSRRIGEGEWKLDGMMKVIEEEVQARERTTAPAVKKPNKELPTAAALLAGGNSSVTCCYCRQPHPSHSCQVVTQLQDRKQILLRYGRCFVCLRRGHVSRDCHSRSKCSQCGGKHHPSICAKGLHPNDNVQPKLATTNSSQAGPPASGVSSTRTESVQSTLNVAAPTFQSQAPATALWVRSDQAVLLQTARASVFNPHAPDRYKQVRIVFDCGSQKSYITEQVARELALQPEGEQALAIKTFGSNEERAHVCKVMNLSLVLKNGSTRLLKLFMVPLICEPVTCQPISFCQDSFRHLSQLDLADPPDGSPDLDIDILIGSDLYWEIVTGELCRGVFGPVALNTELGWVLSGPVGTVGDSAPTCLITHTLRIDGTPHDDLQALDDRLKSFWDLESFGISGSDCSVSVYKKFGESIRFSDGRYEVQLPWKQAHPTLPDNYNLSLKRLRGLIRRLKQNPVVLREYDAIIKDQIQKGMVELVEQPGNAERAERVHYLPHHAVVREDKDTTKVRVVYDASAHVDGPSLNECLHTGQILLRFRLHRIGIIADIEKAFLMVAIAREDRDALRFLWFDDVQSGQADVIELRFTRVVFGVSSSPFLLNATIRHHLEQYRETQPELVEKICKSFYVDDVVSGADTEEEAYQLFENSRKILKDGGFNLRKFCSNSVLLQAQVDEEDTTTTQPSPLEPTGEWEETYTSSTLGPRQKVISGEQKVLGVRWNKASDQLVLSLEDIASAAAELAPTKRNIIAIVGKFYDPIGLLAPVVVKLKMFFQELCSIKLEWDQPLTDELLRRWNALKFSLNEGQTVHIPRCYLAGVSGQPISHTLCGFCDASLKAYAGVVYLLTETEMGNSVRFVAAKTRVTPLKKQTIPRLELLSALLLARLLATVTQSLEDEMQLMPPRCFTDSTVSLCWIKGTDKIWKQFVQNRVDEIRELVHPDSWSHCSGRDNPADLPSRGVSPLELSRNVLWWSGPEWLSDGNSVDDHSLPEFPNECLTEMRIKDRQAVHGMLAADHNAGLSRVIDSKRFNTLDRLLATTTAVLKFCKILLNESSREDTTNHRTMNATAEELWILESQKMIVADKSFKQWQQQLDLFRDERGLWRCRGRIQNAGVPYCTKHPVLLHKDHHFTMLIVKQAHSRVLHGGVKETLAELRSKFWIVRGRNFVKSIIHQCYACRRYEGQPYSAPPPPPLPTFRVEESPPFSFTGVDFAGPLYVKSDGPETKVWMCLYTCCVVRAVHLDLVADLTTPAFLRSFKRFVARRGMPQKMLSDNGKTFKAAAKALPDLKWIFNVPKAPWWGGVFERLIRSTKRCLRKIVGRAKFSHDELLTVITEIEMVINSRPLSYMSASDLEEPLTPSHLIVGRRLMDLPNDVGNDSDVEFDVDSSALTRRARYLSLTVDRFWERWRREYLVGLREVHMRRQRKSSSPRVSVGDIVIVHNDDQPQGMWKLGRIEELLVGADHEVRGAVLRVARQGRQAERLMRPVQKLYPLELSSEQLCEEQRVSADDREQCGSECPEDAQLPTTPGESDDCQDRQPLRRSRRAAAAITRDRLLAQAIEGDDNLD